jgi:L-ascorbate metabolism protein UlaG (beta-lactamase superfamily)
MMKRAGAILTAFVILATAAIGLATRIGPDLSGYDAYRVLEVPVPAGALKVTFLGVSTLLFDDGETAIMTDGFFSRPGLFSVVTRILPDSATIRTMLDRAGVNRLAAVIPVHSHYDHAMDAPYVAKLTGAQLIGSTSTANVGRGGGLPEDRITVAISGQPMAFGRFTVVLLESRHAPTGRLLMPGEIASPLIPPARTSDYRLGTAYSVVIMHDDRTILVQGSAGFIPGALRDVRADVVYLGVAGLGKQSAAYRDSLWNEVVVATGAKRVIAVHWDDFTRPLTKPLRPMPRLFDDFDETMRFLASRTGSGTPDIRIATEFLRTDPFAGLPHQ